MLAFNLIEREIKKKHNLHLFITFLSNFETKI